MTQFNLNISKMGCFSQTTGSEKTNKQTNKQCLKWFFGLQLQALKREKQQQQQQQQKTRSIQN